MVTQLKEEVIEIIRKNRPLKHEIRNTCGVSDVQVWTWLKTNHSQLTRHFILEIISRTTDIPIDDLLEPVPMVT